MQHKLVLQASSANGPLARVSCLFFGMDTRDSGDGAVEVIALTNSKNYFL
jgi:hypothetical protein